MCAPSYHISVIYDIDIVPITAALLAVVETSGTAHSCLWHIHEVWHLADLSR